MGSVQPVLPHVPRISRHESHPFRLCVEDVVESKSGLALAMVYAFIGIVLHRTVRVLVVLLCGCQSHHSSSWGREPRRCRHEEVVMKDKDTPHWPSRPLAASRSYSEDAGKPHDSHGCCCAQENAILLLAHGTCLSGQQRKRREGAQWGHDARKSKDVGGTGAHWTQSACIRLTAVHKPISKQDLRWLMMGAKCMHKTSW